MTTESPMDLAPRPLAPTEPTFVQQNLAHQNFAGEDSAEAAPRPGPVGPRPRTLSAIVANRGLLAIVDQGVVSAASLATALVIGRALGQEALGTYHLAIGFFYLFQSVAEQTIHLPYLIRRNYVAPDTLPRFTGSILAHTGSLASIGVILLWGVAAWIARDADSRPLALAIFIVGCMLPLMLGRDFVHNLLHARLEQRRALNVDVCVFAIQMSILAALYFLSLLSVPMVLLGMGVACGVTSLTWMVRHKCWFTLDLGATRSNWIDNWSIGRWALGSFIVGSGAPIILPWILVATHGISATGRLAACMMLVGLAQMFLRGTSKYLSPASAHAYGSGAAPALVDLLRKFAWLYLATLTPLALALGLFGEEILTLCFGGEYSGAGMAMLLLAISFWLQSFDMVVGNGLNAMSKSDTNFWADCARCVATIVASALAIPMAGVTGVAAALLLGTLAGLIARTWLFGHRLAAAASA